MDHQRKLRRILSSVRFGTLLSVAFFIGFVAVSVVFADDALPKPQIGGLPFSGKTAAGSISALAKQVVMYTGVIGVIALTWGGFLFITAFGEDEKVKKGKNVITYALLGVVLSIAAYGIIDIVNRLTV